jgi:hypothetical protein
MSMARTGVIGVPMGDNRTLDRSRRIDEEAARLAEQALGQDFQPSSGVGHRDKVSQQAPIGKPACHPGAASA